MSSSGLTPLYFSVSPDPRLMLPSTTTSGSPGTPKKSWKRVWRSWMRLSRFQRSLFYLFLCVVGILLLYLYSQQRLPQIDDLAERLERREQERQQREQQQLQQQQQQQEDKQLARPEVDKEKEQAIQHGRPRNRVEAVHNVVLPGPIVADDEKHNRAKEDDYEDEDDDEDDDANEDYGAKRRRRPGQQPRDDSNQALEDEDEPVAADKSLPPADGSLVFQGPQNERQRAVVAAFQHAWTNYRRFAWGQDHLKPVSKSAHNWFGLGLTIVDSLDTMYIMGLKEDFAEARDWVADKLTVGVDRDVNLFETTIRVLGGLLAAFHLSADQMFLDKAKDLGDRLMGAFGSPSDIPYSDVNLRSNRGHAPKWSSDSSTAEVSTIQLEFRDLSRCTGNPSYEEKVAAVSRKIHELNKPDGLVPIFINANTGKFRVQSTITLGARGDSYYEYLVKQWLQTGKTMNYLKEDFVTAVDGIMNKLARRTSPNNLLFFGEILSGGKDFKPKMDELVCFLPGTLALGVHHGLPKSHMQIAEDVAYTCYLTFARQQTFLAPEITYYNTDPKSKTDFTVKPNDAHYLLRPETIESLWYLYYFTGNKTYQDWGWKIFQGIEKYTRVTHGYTTIGNVRSGLDLRPKDMMESFFLGETLKYFYLLFADRHEIDLDRWVFNTEGHPLPIRPN